MIKFIRVFYIFFFLLYLSSSIAQKINIVPQPQRLLITDDRFEAYKENLELHYISNPSRQVKLAIEDLNDVFGIYFNADLSTSIKNDKKFYIGLLSGNNEFTDLLGNDVLTQVNKIEDEGYLLSIKSDKIVIAANGQKGLFYGIQSLKQIIRGLKGAESIPGLTIIDWPAFKYRAVMDDISRGPIPTLDYMKYQIRRFSELKINTVIHYVEHVVKTEAYPEFAPDDGSLTIDEWKEIADYAEKYYITVIGGFQSFGHFQNILSTPEYAHLGESGSLISPVKEESYEFLENIYKEMIPAFHSEFFNINCDETFDLGKEDSKELVDSLGYGEVYYQHIMKLYRIVKEEGKRVIMWGDILMEYPDLLDKLPEDILIGTWNYDARDTFEEFIDPFKNSVHEFWVVPGVLNSRRIYPDFNKALSNIKVFVEEGYEAGASGVLNCFWDDGSIGLFSNDWYGVAYGADKSWNVYSEDKTFDQRYLRGSMASSDILFADAIRKINELRFLELSDGMTDKFLFSKIVPDSGRSLRISIADIDEAERIISSAEDLVSNSEINNYSEDIEYFSFIIDLYKILFNERSILLDAAGLYRSALTSFPENKTYARKNIVKAIDLINGIIENQISLKNRFEILWLKENHTYALDWITDKYDSKINDFRDVKQKLMLSLKRLDSSLPILPAEDIRLSISKLPGKYFTEWMMVNPLPNVDSTKLSSIDYLEDMGGEKSAAPKVTQEFYFNDNKYRWRRVVSEEPDINNLAEMFDNSDDYSVMYAFANITVDKDIKTRALVSGMDGIEVFINGQSAGVQESEDLLSDTKSLDIDLKKGKNNLLLKISTTKGDWGFTFRLPDVDVRSRKNRYRIIN